MFFSLPTVGLLLPSTILSTRLQPTPLRTNPLVTNLCLNELISRSRFNFSQNLPFTTNCTACASLIILKGVQSKFCPHAVPVGNPETELTSSLEYKRLTYLLYAVAAAVE